MSNHEDDTQRPSKRPRLSPSDAEQDIVTAIPTTLINESKPAKLNEAVLDPKETEVGISEFVSQDVTPFQALLKTRYTDFVVNEILPDGQVVRLTNTSVPEKLQLSGSNKKRSSKKAESPSAVSNGAASVPHTDVTANGEENAASNPAIDGLRDSSEAAPLGEVSDEDKGRLISYLNETAANQLLELYRDIIKYPTRKAKDHIMVRTEFTKDRSIRTEIHQAIRNIFSFKIDSSTDNAGFLCLTAASQKSRQPPPTNNDEDKPFYPGKLGRLERGGDYLHFTLYKENKDTMEAISFLARQLKVGAKAFQFAGTKDRRAVSAQRVSAYRLDAERLAKQNYHLHNAAVGDFEYQPTSLELGDLGGNEFLLTLRDCSFPQISGQNEEEIISKIQSALDLALTNLRTRGFLNYYGLQRFGTFATRTDATGLHILKGDFRSACEAILHYNPESLASTNDEQNPGEASAPNPSLQYGPSRDEASRAQAIQLFQKTGNAHSPLELLPKKFSAENQIMRHLSRTPTDYIGALLNIPRNLRLMYVHAYQSLVWNKAVTNRWVLYGSKVVEGDLVLIKEHKDKEAHAAPPTDLETSGIDADGEVIIMPQQHDRSGQIDDIFDRARALTETEASSGDYTIFDIVLPLPGYDVLYPSNASGQFYKDFMGSDEGGNLDPYDMRRKQKDFSLSGGYRKILANIGPEFSIQVHKYRRDEEQFVETDLERLRKARSKMVEEEQVGAAGGETETGDVAMKDGGVDDSADEVKDKIAAVLKFQLGASQYATMALRELSRGGVTAYKAEFGTMK